MNKFSQLLAKIRKTDWWSEECSADYQKFLYPVSGAIGQRQFFHPKYIDFAIFVFRNDFVYEESPIDQKQEIYGYIYNKVKSNKGYLRKKRSDSLLIAKAFFREGAFFEKNKLNLKNREIWKSYKRFIIKNYFDYICYVYTLECVDVVDLAGLISKENKIIPKNKVDEVAFIMASPEILSFMEKARAIFLKACLSSTKKERIENIKLLTKDYFWMENNYRRSKMLNSADFESRIAEELKRHNRKGLRKELLSLESKVERIKSDKKKILKKYVFSDDLMKHFEIIKFIGEWIDERKGNLMLANHFIEVYCNEIARRFDLPLQDVNYYLIDEIKDLLLRGKKVKTELLAKRKKNSAVVMYAGKTKKQVKMDFYFAGKANEIYNAVFSAKQDAEIKGFVASKPVDKISGKVQLVLDPDNVEFTRGRILLTTMTRPDFIPIARQASAIITDEGGITCHAAVLSRELKIPCVIGAKKATKVLKDDDFVEIDLKTGIIKKISELKNAK